MNDPLLDVRGVAAGYGDITVLRDVDLMVPAGSAVALLGPNGAGKTTLLHTISGFIKPNQGEILLGGEHVTGTKPERLCQRGLCHVPEGRGIFPSLSVKENLLVFAHEGARAAILERASEAFPALGRRMALTAGNLSGGEQQMLALARAYLSSPKLLLVDEASMGLAPLVVDWVFEFLERMKAEGVGLLIVEQYVTRALAFADYAYILNHGRIVFSGPANEVDSAEVFRQYLSVDIDATS